MKFAQYLSDTQTPEWKKAYIDYRGLKKRITAIRKAQQGLNIHVAADGSSSEAPSPPSTPRPSNASSALPPAPITPGGTTEHRPSPSLDHDASGLASSNPPPSSFFASARPSAYDTSALAESTDDDVSPLRTNQGDTPSSIVPQQRPQHARRPSFAIPSLRLSRTKKSSRGSNGPPGPLPNPLARLPLHELLAQLSPPEVAFFTMLDAQLDKVESFYLAREKEMIARGQLLHVQLLELSDHRRLFKDANRKGTWITPILNNVKARLTIHPDRIPRVNSVATTTPFVMPAPVPTLTKHLSDTLSPPPPTHAHTYTHSSTQPSAPGVVDRQHSKSSEDYTETIASIHPAPSHTHTHENEYNPSKESKTTKFDLDAHHLHVPRSEDGDHRRSGEGERRSIERSRERDAAMGMGIPADPDSYLYAKAKLKRAVLEYYRGLEVLHNYRVLNVTGFRKALKKFEKVTRIQVQDQYMAEKVERSAFASDKALREMMTKMEELYAQSFASGDKKKAMRRLRSGNSTKSHHYSTFRTGLLLGLAVPAFVDGMIKVFQPATREAIPHWDILLYLYAVLTIPVLFTLLVGINLLVWARARINYVFIFELEVLSRLDHREYFEIPSRLLCTLIYAFWLSFSHAGAPRVDPTIWPLVWLGSTVVVVFNPLPVMFRSSRFWLARNLGALFMSGTRPVEFTDFWLGDQLCSLMFTLSNVFLFVCSYAQGFEDWQHCGSAHRMWPLSFFVASLPLLIRLVQSVKRFHDSGLSAHLVNGGKYGSGIVAYFLYFLWRHGGSKHDGVLVVWTVCNTIYSLYAGAWDLLMDWSLMRVRSKHPFLRDELVYSNHVYLYYFAIISNSILRFAWVMYIPLGGPTAMTRTFIAGFLEMLRRWQWNFYRLENEHIGNMDQYRATREVPLPYAFDDGPDANDDDDDRRLKVKSRR